MPVRLNQMGESGEIPCIFPRNRETACRDTFEDDCLHRELVRCFSRESSLSEIIAKVPRLSLAKVGASGPRERRLENADALACQILCWAILRSGYVRRSYATRRSHGSLMPASRRTESQSLSARRFGDVSLLHIGLAKFTSVRSCGARLWHRHVEPV